VVHRLKTESLTSFKFFGASTVVEGLLLVLRLFGTNSLMTNSSLSQKLLEFSTLNTSGGAEIF